MKRLIVMISLVGCGGDDGGGGSSASCDEMSRAVTQARGTCRLAFDPDGPFGTGCSAIQDAYCGDEANCPSGWGLSCESSPNDPNVGINCTYGDSGSCTVVDADTVEYDYVQTLNGATGLIVRDISQADRCVFMPCNPL